MQPTAVVETAGGGTETTAVGKARSRRPVKIVAACLISAVLLAAGSLLGATGAMDWLTGKKYSEEEMRREYNRGNAAGESSGYDRGYSAGKEAGYSDGYSTGKSAGCRSVFEKVRTDSGYSAIVAWDTFWNRSRGSYYYQASSTCD